MLAPRRTTWAALLVSAVAWVAAPAPPAFPEEASAESVSEEAPAFDPETEKLLYAIGVIVGRRLEEFHLTEQEYAVVERAIHDVVARNELFVNENALRKRITKFMAERRALRLALHKQASQRFLDRAAEREGAVKTAGGVVVSEVRPGRGARPTPTSLVRIHYHGRVYDGSVFDSSVERGEPELLNLAGALPCWREGLPLVQEGGKSRITCPASRAYGDQGSGAVPGGAAIVYEVELLEVVR